MRHRLVQAIQLMLFHRFDERLPDLLRKGDALETSEATCTTALLSGYREGYFEAIEDLAEAGLLRYPGAFESSIGDHGGPGLVH